jgi:hypothetical protein
LLLGFRLLYQFLLLLLLALLLCFQILLVLLTLFSFLFLVLLQLLPFLLTLFSFLFLVLLQLLPFLLALFSFLFLSVLLWFLTLTHRVFLLSGLPEFPDRRVYAVERLMHFITSDIVAREDGSLGFSGGAKSGVPPLRFPENREDYLMLRAAMRQSRSGEAVIGQLGSASARYQATRALSPWMVGLWVGSLRTIFGCVLLSDGNGCQSEKIARRCAGHRNAGRDRVELSPLLNLPIERGG